MKGHCRLLAEIRARVDRLEEKGKTGMRGLGLVIGFWGRENESRVLFCVSRYFFNIQNRITH